MRETENWPRLWSAGAWYRRLAPGVLFHWVPACSVSRSRKEGASVTSSRTDHSNCLNTIQMWCFDAMYISIINTHSIYLKASCNIGKVSTRKGTGLKILNICQNITGAERINLVYFYFDGILPFIKKKKYH